MSSQPYNYKLTSSIKMKVLAMIARGEKYGTILGMLEKDHNISYGASGLTILRKKHDDVIKMMQGIIIDTEVAEAEKIRNRALRRLNMKLDRAEREEDELDHLAQEYREDPDMTLGEYRKRKAGLLQLSTTELLNISKEMHVQTGKSKSPTNPALPAGDGVPSSDTAQLSESLLAAIKAGDTVTLQQIQINA